MKKSEVLSSHEKSKEDSPKFSCSGLLHDLLDSSIKMAIGTPGERAWFNILLVFFPLAFISNRLNWGDLPTFFLSLVALIPFAERLGFCTESLADHTNDTFGGLMNATMGNLPEVSFLIIFSSFECRFVVFGFFL
jgi:hypothetical protein